MNHSAIDYLLIGHMTADLLPAGGRAAGGTVSYAARTAAAFGLRVGVVTACAPDEPLLAALTPYAQVVVVPSPATTTYENLYTPHGREQYVRAVARDIRPADIPPAWRTAPLLHVAPIAGEAQDADLYAPFSHARRLLTLQGWLRHWGDDGKVSFRLPPVPPLLACFDLVVLSVEDLRGEVAHMDALAQYAPYTVMTQAEQGGTLYTPDGSRIPYDTPSVSVIDPTGAGDIFATALLCAWHALGDLKRALPVAARLAADSVTWEGMAGAPTPSAVRSALADAGG